MSRNVLSPVLEYANKHLVLPPAYNEDPIGYGIALASMLAIAFTSISFLLSYVLHARRLDEINRQLANPIVRTHPHQRTLWQYHRLIMSGFFMTLIMLTLPQAITLSLWGEGSATTMGILYRVQITSVSLCWAPYFMSAIIALAIRKPLSHRLHFEPSGAPTRFVTFNFQWHEVRDKLKIVVGSAILAIGITFYKTIAL